MPPQFSVPTPPQVNLSDLQHINPQQLAEGMSVLNQFKLGGGGGGGTADMMSAFQPNQSALQNRNALQALSGYEAALKNQGGTRGAGWFGKEAEAKGGGLLGGFAGGAGGAAAGAALGTAIFPGIGTVLGGLGGALFGNKIGSSAGGYLSSKTGPGQFEQTRQSTATNIAALTGMPEATILQNLPDYGEDPTLAQNKLNTLKTILSSGYSGSLQPAGMNLPQQQSFGGISPGLSNLPANSFNTGINQGINALKGVGSEAGSTLAELGPEALAL